MLDVTGKLVRRGDRISMGGLEGVVVFSIDTDEYSSEFPKQDWSYLTRGTMVETERAGLVYLEESDEDTLILDQNSN
jgi:hypothetical protein